MTPNIAWTPSAARTIAPLAWSPAIADRGLPWPLFDAIPLEWPAKASAELLDYTLDLSRWAADGGDSISTVAAPVLSNTGVADDLGVVWFTAAGQGVTLALSGGVPNTTYTIGLQVTSTLGRIGYWTAQIAVNAFSPATAPASATNPPGVANLADGAFIFTPANLPTGAMQIPGATYLNGGVLGVSAGPDSNSTARLDFTFAGIPTSDPGISGRLWSQSGVVFISAGPLGPQTLQDQFFAGLPTVDPLVPNQPWSNGGALTFSAGPT